MLWTTGISNTPTLPFYLKVFVNLIGFIKKHNTSSSKMKVVAAYMLAVLGGNNSPSAKDIRHILKAVGTDADEQEVNKLIGEMEGKNVFDVISEGREKLASVTATGVIAQVSVPIAVVEDELVLDADNESDTGSDVEGGFGNLFV
jgi:large subunit ribosomal protein LP2